MLTTSLLRCCALSLFLVAASLAATANTAVDPATLRTEWSSRLREMTRENTTTLTSKQAKRLEKWQQKIARKAAKKGTEVDFNDPVERWLWLGLFGLGIGIVLGVLSLGSLGALVGLAGLVCLVVWLLKKTGSV